MARGRMLNTSISLNEDVAEIYDRVGADGALVFTWLIAHLDCEGRMKGEPRIIAATVAPLLSGVTPDLVRNMLTVASELGLLDWYEVGGKKWISFRNFERNQVGLRKNREKESTVPPPDTSGSTPEQCRKMAAEKNGTEEKRTEEKRTEQNAPEESGATSSWSPGEPISNTADLEMAASEFQIQAGCLSESSRKLCYALTQADPILPHEYRYALEETRKKPRKRPVDYFLGVIRGQREDAQNTPAPTLRATSPPAANEAAEWLMKLAANRGDCT